MIRITAELRAELEEVSTSPWWSLHVSPSGICANDVDNAVIRGDLGALRLMVDVVREAARVEDELYDEDNLYDEAQHACDVMLQIESAMAAAIADGA